MSNFAWVTLATNDSYSLGALVVAHSLKRVETAHKLVVVITPGVSDVMRSKLQDVFDVVQFVNVLDSKDAANLAVLKRPELGITFTKLHCWNLTQFDKCVFLDADVLVLQNCDELFEREELSAAADVGWPDCFNTGVFVFKPSSDTYGKLIKFAESVGSFDGADQGLLNQYFSNWSTGDSSRRLPFLYNTASTATYSYLPAFKHFNKDVKILHFIGDVKPWVQQFNSVTRQVQSPTGYSHLQDFLQLWWNIFCEKVHPVLSDAMNIPWLSRFEDNCVQYNYPCDYSDPPATIVDAHSDNHNNYNSNNNNNNINEEENQVRTYDPYLIAYHEDSNTFTYNDPWVDDRNNRNENENSNNNCTNNNNNTTINNQINVDNIDSTWTRMHEHSNGCNDLTHASEITTTSLPSMTSASILQSSSDLINNNTIVNENQSVENISHITCDKDHSPSSIVEANSDNVTDERKSVTESNSLSNIKNNEKISVKGKPISTRKSGIAGALANLQLGTERSAEQQAYEDQFRRANWESGHIDYLGQDSFANIWKKIQTTIEAPPAEVVEQQERRRSRSRSKTPQREPSPKPVEKKSDASAAPIEPAKAVEEPVKVAAPVKKQETVPAAQTKPVASKPVVSDKPTTTSNAPASTAATTTTTAAAPVAPKKKEGGNYILITN